MLNRKISSKVKNKIVEVSFGLHSPFKNNLGEDTNDSAGTKKIFNLIAAGVLIGLVAIVILFVSGGFSTIWNTIKGFFTQITNVIPTP